MNSVNIKRYTPTGFRTWPTMRPDANGEYVEYEDHVKAMKALQEKLDEAEADLNHKMKG
jgi:hypothetical protein